MTLKKLIQIDFYCTVCCKSIFPPLKINVFTNLAIKKTVMLIKYHIYAQKDQFDYITFNLQHWLNGQMHSRQLHTWRTEHMSNEHIFKTEYNTYHKSLTFNFVRLNRDTVSAKSLWTPYKISKYCLCYWRGYPSFSN